MSWKLKPFPEAFIDPKSFINNGISAMRQGNTEHEESIIIERRAQPPVGQQSKIKNGRYLSLAANCGAVNGRMKRLVRQLFSLPMPAPETDVQP